MKAVPFGKRAGYGFSMYNAETNKNLPFIKRITYVLQYLTSYCKKVCFIFWRQVVFHFKMSFLYLSTAFLLAALFTTRMLASYKTHIGNVTNDNVNTSEVGVMTAATIRIITIACFR